MFAHHIQQSLIAQIGAYNDPLAAKSLNDFALDPTKVRIYPISVAMKGPFVDLDDVIHLQGLPIPVLPLKSKYFAGTMQLIASTGEVLAIYANSNGADTVKTYTHSDPLPLITVEDIIFSTLRFLNGKGTVILTGVIIAADY